MFFALVVCLAVVAAAAICRDWLRWRDVFHPTIFCVPQLMFLYVALPLHGLATDELEFLTRAGYWSQLTEFQFITDIMCFALIAGIGWGCRGAANSPTPIMQNPKAIFMIGIAFGLLGSTAWIVGIANVGGFDAA